MLELIVKNLIKTYDSLEVLKGIDLCVSKSEIVCIVGPSGCGKSTLLNIIGGILKEDSGSIANTYSRTAYVFQEDRLLPWRTVEENIRLVNDAFTREETIDLLKTLGIGDFMQALPSTLSGGMRQRASIARAFAYQPDILLMDEPLKSLDLQLRLNILNLIHEVWRKFSCAIIYVTHEIDEALLLGDRVLVLGERPSRVNKVLQIDIPREKRQFGSKELDAYRDIIISELFRSVKEEI